MTTETRPATSQGIDYTQIDSAIGLNWYDADPNLQQIVERLAAPDDRAFAEEHLRRMGGVMGGPIAARAEITDKNPPTMDFGEARDGAMFRTEIKGGSDLASSECSAMKAKDGWRINGSKSFCSNLDAVAILALARPEGGHPGLQPA